MWTTSTWPTAARAPSCTPPPAPGFKKLCMQNKLNLLDASVRHLGTDINYVVLENLYANYLKDKVDFFFDTPVWKIDKNAGRAMRSSPTTANFTCDKCIISVGRSGSKWMEQVCRDMDIATKSNRVDIGVRVELPAVVFSHLTDELYESKIVYRTEKFEDNVRTFCMNPNGIVVNENTNGIVTVNGHSYEDPAMQTENTNFALLVVQAFLRALQGQQRLRRKHRPAFQYAGRRRHRTALRRPDSRPPQQRQAH